VDKDVQDQSVPVDKTGTQISRHEALVTAAKVGIGGAALTAGIGTGLQRAPSVARAASTITLRFQHWNGAMLNSDKWWTHILAGFTKLHPGVVVENDYIAFPQYLPTLTSMAAAKTLPDIFYAHVLAAQLGRAGLSINYRDHLPASFINQFFASPIKQFTFDGTKLYALPLSAQVFGIFHNNALMSKLGLQPPNTWDDLIAMVPTIKKAGLVPLVWGNSLSNTGPDFFLPLITQYGGDVYALDALTRSGLSWNSEPVVKAFELLAKLNKAGVFNPGLNGITQSPQAEQMFYHGQAVTHWDGSFFVANASLAAPKSFLSAYSVSKEPAITSSARHWTGDGSGEGLAINAHGPHIDLALDFLRYLFSPAVYNLWVKQSVSFPSMPSAKSAVSDPILNTMVDYLVDGADHILFGAGSWNAVSNAVTSVLQGSLTPQAAAAQVQSAVLKTRAGRH
jgi:raffinose/stachyose/melibiose transport system substrate-binding protein